MAEEQGRRAKKRKPSKDVNTLKREIADREAAAAARKAERKPSGAAARPDLQFQKKDPPAPEPEKPKYTGYNYSQHSRSRGTENQVPLRYTYRPFREEVLVDYLLDEGFASDEKSASAIVGAMSEEWKESILDEASEEDKQRLRDYEIGRAHV